MKRALFLDRDGVINVNTGYVNRVIDFHFVDGIFELCRAYRALGYKIIVVTNQAGIAHGFLAPGDLEHIHSYMEHTMFVGGAILTDIYHCPDKEGPNRKPEPGMILQAQREHDIDLAASTLIGDNITDIEAGRRAGVGCCILIPSGNLGAVRLPV